MDLDLGIISESEKRLKNDNFVTNLWQTKVFKNIANLTYYKNMNIFDALKGNNMQNERLEKKKRILKKDSLSFWEHTQKAN